MPDLSKIYHSAAERYQALVGREDHEDNLLPAILEITPLQDKTVLELGAGTGRISCQIVPMVSHLFATDISYHMLAHGKKRLANTSTEYWSTNLQSHAALCFADDSMDVVISGWSFCYAALDAGENWRPALESALAEVRRVMAPGGTLILIESLGTGFETPHAPPVLQKYLRYLNNHSFKSRWIRTDYCFKDSAEAQDLTRFFFGEDPMQMQTTEKGVIVPECTGLWWQTYP